MIKITFFPFLFRHPEKSEIEELLTLVEKAKTLAGKLSLEKHNMAINIHLLSAYALLKLKK